jgi:hypothetical protein
MRSLHSALFAGQLPKNGAGSTGRCNTPCIQLVSSKSVFSDRWERSSSYFPVESDFMRCFESRALVREIGCAQGIGAYGSVGGNGRNGGHRSSGANNIVNPSFSGDPPASKIAALARKDFGAQIRPSRPNFLHLKSANLATIRICWPQ